MEVSLSFKSKAQYNKFMRNMRNGKGTVISQKNVDMASGGNILNDIKKTANKVIGGIKKVGRNKEVKKFMNSIRPALREIKSIGKQAVHQKISDMAMAGADNLGPNDILKKQALNVVANTAHEKVAGLGFKPASLKKLMKPVNAGMRAIKTGVRANMPKALTNMPRANMTQFGAFGSPDYLANVAKGAGYVDSLGGDGVLQSVQNINSVGKGKSKKGGSFTLPR